MEVVNMLSIIIPMYNRADLVGETLDSVLTQTYQDWECIVVDDGSTDNSLQVVQEYCNRDQRIRLMSRPVEREKGVSTCRNIGVENTTSEYVYFLDSDDLLSPEFSQTIIEAIKNYPEAEYAAFQFDAFLESPSKPTYRSRKFNPAKGTLFEQIMINHVQSNTQTYLWKRSLLECVPMMWREGFRYACDDLDFTKRIICTASNGIWFDIPCLIHVRHSNTNSIAGNYKKNISRKIKILLFFENESYQICAERGLMTDTIHKGFLRSLLRIQLIDAVLFHAQKDQYQYYDFLKNIATNNLYDRMICVSSRLIITLTSLLYLCGNICCCLPVIGKQFIRAKTK
jgi:glycosyltransferase involved in cell wall biosynthesis